MSHAYMLHIATKVHVNLCMNLGLSTRIAHLPSLYMSCSIYERGWNALRFQQTQRQCLLHYSHACPTRALTRLTQEHVVIPTVLSQSPAERSLRAEHLALGLDRLRSHVSQEVDLLHSAVNNHL